MFTGLVQATGRVVESAPFSPPGGRGGKSASMRRVRIDPGRWKHGAMVGDSISVSGCCLTVARDPAEIGGMLEFHAVRETIRRVKPGLFEKGSRVNLEGSLRAGDAMGGHVVQGHVDGVGEVIKVQKGDDWRIRIRPGAPLDPETHGKGLGGEGLAQYLTPKGSVTVEGVSLTVAELSPPGDKGGPWFGVALIPTTLQKTTLKGLKRGDAVNLEMDVFAKTIVFWLRRYAM